eukprot:GEMP01026173.1.p1 GENE.GEMP01026173.1~~GEMP01026173.1.p1  ORF type:complete len:129 (+),score=21.21 GEMP01026173.1:58-387(+)
MPSEKYSKIGEIGFGKMEKVSSELLALMYGSLVTQLVKDNGDDIEGVNAQLDKMGMNIGLRMADEFFAKSGISYCQDFRDSGRHRESRLQDVPWRDGGCCAVESEHDCL